MSGTDEQYRWLDAGLAALRSARFFEAHALFERGMDVTTPPLHTLFRGLAQLAAAHHQLTLGRGRAAVRTWQRARAKLASVNALTDSFANEVDALHARLGLTSEAPRFLDVSKLATIQFAVPDREMLGPLATTAAVDRTRGEHASRNAGSTTMSERTSAPSTPHQESAQGLPEATGFVQLLDLRILSISESEVTAELPVSPRHHQPMGIVHGGVYCSIVETICSMGAFVHASKHKQFVVGVDNQTSFLKATRGGTLRAAARPLSIGRKTQLWEANIKNEQGVLVATGRVRLICVDPEANLGGQAAGTAPTTPR